MTGDAGAPPPDELVDVPATSGETAEITLSDSASLTETALRLRSDLEFAEWEQVGAVLGKVRDATAFAFGDWYLWGEAAFGEVAAQGVEATGRSKTTLLEYVRVARQVPPSRRRPSLSWTHHQLVAAREPDEQKRLLDLAEEGRLSVEELRGVLSAERALSTRRNERRPEPEIVRLVFEVGRLLVAAAEPLDARHARVPLDVLDRLANALGVDAPLPAEQQRLIDVPTTPKAPHWA